jgi:hypothetical protein
MDAEHRRLVARVVTGSWMIPGSKSDTSPSGAKPPDRRALLIAALVYILALPSVVAGQPVKVGMVVAVTGEAVRQAEYGSPPPERLKLNDAVFLQDTLTTVGWAYLMVLLGGKLEVAFGSRSTVKIQEAPGRSWLDVQNGGVTCNVLLPFRANKVVEIRTPNAIAIIRNGLHISVATLPPTEGGQPVTHVDVLEGATLVATTGGRGLRSWIELRADDGITFTGDVAGPVRALRFLKGRVLSPAPTRP